MAIELVAPEAMAMVPVVQPRSDQVSSEFNAESSYYYSPVVVPYVYGPMALLVTATVAPQSPKACIFDPYPPQYVNLLVSSRVSERVEKRSKSVPKRLSEPSTQDTRRMEYGSKVGVAEGLILL